MEISRYSDDYLNHVDGDMEKYLDSEQDVGDLYYYEAIKKMECTHEELRSAPEDDFNGPEEYEVFSKFIEDNSIKHKNYVRDYRNISKSHYPMYGIVCEDDVKIGDKIYKVLTAEDMGYVWYYFTKEFSERLSELTGIKVKESVHPVEFIY